MSLGSETNVQDYAHQCAIQRRRYEECLQKARQSCEINPINETEVSHHPDECLQQAMQSCVVELLELTVEPLGWNDESLIAEASREALTDEYPATHQPSPRSLTVSSTPISYSAP